MKGEAKKKAKGMREEMVTLGKFTERFSLFAKRVKVNKGKGDSRQRIKLTREK